MKKTLLGLGLWPLSILPMMAIASCSTTTSTLEKEVAKFKTPVVTKDKETSAATAAASIKDTETPSQRITSLNKIAVIPKLASGFAMVVNFAGVSIADSNSVEVNITITETSSKTAQDVVLTISGFLTRSNLLDLQASLFKTRETDTKQSTSDVLNTHFSNTNHSNIDKLNFLAFDVCGVSGFPAIDSSKYNIYVGEATPVGPLIDATAIQIQIILSTVEGPAIWKDVTWTITGFLTTIELNANLFIKETKTIKPTMTAQAAISSINNEPDATKKQQALTALALWPISDSGLAFNPSDWTIVIGEARVKNPGAIEVYFTIDYKSSPLGTQKTRPKAITWTILGFKQ